ncbi:hypothetical protein MKW98_027394 [Papaver atlanticum]|uniref:Uncharacterized protein n=1 Tax=Papaver atlanticum TaxID=357466 RepID=A0AAD4THD6_9MAGN|nr:hypothetical protein MKW98_027394 [Papaver atlanticum]
MATWMTAARAVIGRTSNQISRQMLSSSTNQTSKLIHQRRGLTTGSDHQVPPKVDLKQEAKDKKGADYILYTGLIVFFFCSYYLYLAIIDYPSDEERDEKVVRYLDKEVPAS